MIPRPDPLHLIEASFQVHPVTALLGPRQCGKTTLARLIAERESATFFDLENPVDVRRLSAPMQALQDLTGLVIIGLGSGHSNLLLKQQKTSFNTSISVLNLPVFPLKLAD